MTAKEKKDPYPFSFMAVTFLVTVSIASIAKQHLNSDAAWGLGACSSALLIAAKARWELKSEWWFWVALFVGAASQLPLVLLVPWSNLTGIGAMAFVLPGFLMALGCVFIAEKIFKKSTDSEHRGT